jgi:uncharacterized protein (TIGR02145 family)
MKSKYLLTILIHIGFANAIYSQSITNVQTSLENNKITISYNLDSRENVIVSVLISEDGGKNFSGPLTKVTGDVGLDVKPGSNKRIVWDVLSERGMLMGNSIVFRVKASRFATFQDPRDNKTYKMVKIGNQIWMAENLAYKPRSGNYWAYDNNSSNVNKYGYLYDWQTAKNVCPTGWHLPSDSEWTALTDYIGDASTAGTKLKAKNGWSSNGNGTDDYGFSALPGGYRLFNGNFNTIGYYGYWWSSTENSTTNAWYRSMRYNNSSVNRYNFDKSWGFSVRCLRDL